MMELSYAAGGADREDAVASSKLGILRRKTWIAWSRTDGSEEDDEIGSEA